ncbi:hypothetical protein TNCV_3726351 [Trichonephila clavipes]|nr:hypothetical protein TNCV_3726351 [Trichonephila clavipes]
MDVCKRIVPSQQGGIQSNRRAASPPVRLVEGEESQRRWRNPKVNINDENMQDLGDQQSSEKDVVQPEDMSHTPTKKCLKNGGFEFEKYVDVGFIA